MSTASQKLLNSFEQLSEPEKQQVAAEILRRILSLDLPPLSNEELVLNAEELFLSLDDREAEDEQQS